MKFSKSLRSNIVSVIILLLFIIPQTRKPIQIGVNKILALVGPSIENADNLESLNDFRWSLQDMDGNSFELSDTKGKVVIINLWATWCAPCIAEMPSLQKLYNDYGEQVEFILVSNEEPQKVRNFLKKHDLSLPTYKGVSSIPKKLYTRSIPATYVLDKKGRIRIQKTGAANWNSKKVRRLLDRLLAK